jgi:sulfite reductase alpha subunit-like flavoprotein
VVPDLGANVIMVGAGTGVSPFLGFVQHRELLSAVDAGKSDWWLFFGCRNESKDFIYREDLEGSVSRGVLHKLTVAFSRDAEEVPTEHPFPFRFSSQLFTVAW